MINEKKFNSSIVAVHDLIIRARNLAYQKKEHEMIGDFLDALEYLPALILEKEDRTELFEKFLEDICKRYDFTEILDKYIRSSIT
ncbi:hypothetical protein D3C71_211570 [compost metagenome]